jgi:hypothetical protein
MGQTLTGRFETRRDAEMTVEQLVQVLGIERTSVFVASAERDNTAGTVKAGSDTVEGQPDPDANPALEGRIEVSVELEDERADEAEAVFRDHNVQEFDRR